MTYEDPGRAESPELTQLYFLQLVRSEELAALPRPDSHRNREQLVGIATQLRASKVPAQVIWARPTPFRYRALDQVASHQSWRPPQITMVCDADSSSPRNTLA